MEDLSKIEITKQWKAAISVAVIFILQHLKMLY